MDKVLTEEEQRQLEEVRAERERLSRKHISNGTLSMEDLKRKLALYKKEDELLGIERKEPVYNVPAEQGFETAIKLTKEFRPFLIKYTDLLHKAQQFIPAPITSEKLQEYEEMYDEVSRCEALKNDWSTLGLKMAINDIENGIKEGEGIGDYIRSLYYGIKLSKDYKHVESKYYYYQYDQERKNKNTDTIGIEVTKEGVNNEGIR